MDGCGNAALKRRAEALGPVLGARDHHNFAELGSRLTQVSFKGAWSLTPSSNV